MRTCIINGKQETFYDFKQFYRALPELLGYDVRYLIDEYANNSIEAALDVYIKHYQKAIEKAVIDLIHFKNQNRDKLTQQQLEELGTIAAELWSEA